MYGPLLFGGLAGLFVLVIFVAIWRLVGQRDPVDERLRKFGISERDLTGSEAVPGASRRLPWSGTNRLLAASNLGARLATALTQADLPLTAAEFTLVVLGSFLAGVVVAGGIFRQGLVIGAVIGALLAFLPILFLNGRRRRRQRAFTGQVPEILTLLVGALRAGYGISQAMGVVVSQLGPPASVEFGRAIRSVALGLSLDRALTDLSLRVGTDEIGMIVTAINVQYETGGNLAQTLDTIGDTVRDRLRIKREIRAMTAQQKLTGYILTALPIGLAAILMFVNPTYMRTLFEPGTMRLVLIAALLMQLVGFVVIRRIVDIEV